MFARDPSQVTELIDKAFREVGIDTLISLYDDAADVVGLQYVIEVAEAGSLAKADRCFGLNSSTLSWRISDEVQPPHRPCQARHRGCVRDGRR